MSLDYLRENNIEVDWDYPSMASEELVYVAATSNAIRADILKVMKASLEASAKQGLTRTEAVRALSQKLKAQGLWDKISTISPENGSVSHIRESSPYRVESLFRTNMQASFMSTKWLDIREDRFDKPFLQYLTQADDRVRPSHRVLHRKVWAVSDPVWNRIYPPNGFNCRCYVRQLTEAQAKRVGTQRGSGIVPKDFISAGFDHNVGRNRFNIFDAMGSRISAMTAQAGKQFLLSLIGSSEMIAYFSDFSRGRSERDEGFVGYVSPSKWPFETGKSISVKHSLLAGLELSDTKKEKIPKALLRSDKVWQRDNEIVVQVSLGLLSNYFVTIKNGAITSIDKNKDLSGYEQL